MKKQKIKEKEKNKIKFKSSEKSSINKNLKFRTIKQSIKSILNEDPKFVSRYSYPKNTSDKQFLCDLTGMPAEYTCSRTGLHFFDSSCYDEIANLRPEIVSKLKEIREFGNELNPFKGKYE